MRAPPGAELLERELWACALEVVKQHGDAAPKHIAERIGALALAGDVAGIKAWKGIAAKVDQLRVEPEQLT
jgi:hypothetical protein